MVKICCESNRDGANCEGIERRGEKRGCWRFVARVIGVSRTARG